MFRIRDFEYKFLQSLGIFKSIVDGFIESFYMEITPEIFHILNEEIKKIFTIIPVTEQKSELICLFILSFDSPKMVESVEYPYKLHTI